MRERGWEGGGGASARLLAGANVTLRPGPTVLTLATLYGCFTLACPLAPRVVATGLSPRLLFWS